FHLSLLVEQDSQIHQQSGEPAWKLDSLTKDFDRLRRSANGMECVAQPDVGVRIIWIEPECPPEAFDCLLILALGRQDVSQLPMESGCGGRDGNGAGQQCFRLLRPVLGGESYGQQKQCL